MMLLNDERDKLKANLAAAESVVAEFSKRSDLANQAQEVTAQAFAEANAQRDVLIDKIAQLEETAECMRAEGYDLKGKNQKLRSEIDKLKGENLKLKSETKEAVKSEILTEVKELYPNLDLSTIEVHYLGHEEAKDGADPPSNDGADLPPVDGA
ncbi:hypothetical protein Fot_07690 [Forsythia ovata]|uniref:Uncharacterized protein n=1 Tax=Forsythia ovata TaxID=205694 RepID=A0ABD1WWJ6_9LAMI